MSILSPLPQRTFWHGKRVFLTGHTGFKGSWALMLLNKLGAEVFGYALAPNTSPSMFSALGLADRCTRHQLGDVNDPEDLKNAVAQVRPDVAIHMAAQPLVSVGYESPVDTFATNAMGVVHFLEACRAASVPTTLVISSDKCYRNNEDGIAFTEIDPLGGKDPYSASKAVTEIIVGCWAESFMNHSTGMLLASARAGNVIGGGDWSRDRLLPDMARSFSSDQAVEVRSPSSVRPWQHVLEPVCGYLLLIEHLSNDPALARGWNFGPSDDAARSVKYVVESAVKSWGNGASWKMHAGSIEAMKESVTLLLNSADAEEKLKWSPRLSLDEAIKWTMDWYKVFYQNPKEARSMTDNQINAYLLAP